MYLSVDNILNSPVNFMMDVLNEIASERDKMYFVLF